MKPLEILRRWKSSSRGNIVSALPFLGSIERDGEEFFQCGSLVVNTLNKVGECLKGRQFDELDRFYEETFSGSSLGLNCAELDSERDGIHSFQFCAKDTIKGRAGAIREWQRYIQSFDQTEELSLHLHKIENWKAAGPLVTSVRFEHIGIPRGAKTSCIDRAYFRVVWERSPGALLLSAQAMINGERTASDRPQFPSSLFPLP